MTKATCGKEGFVAAGTSNHKRGEEQQARLPDHPFFVSEKHWYVIHTYSGHENKVKTNLDKRVKYMEMQDKIFRVLVPTEKQYETKNGQRKTIFRKLFPGYVLVEMVLDEHSWFVVRNTPSVTGFVGPGNKPVSLTEAEIHPILKRINVEDARPSVEFDLQEQVQVTSGPFNGFIGTVAELVPEKAKLKLTISLFGRETLVELSFDRVAKL